MAGGPNLVRREGTPAPAQTRKGAPAEGQTHGKAALKRSVCGMDFAQGEAALAPKDGELPMFAGSGGGGGERKRREDAKAEARKGPRDEMWKIHGGEKAEAESKREPEASPTVKGETNKDGGDPEVDEMKALAEVARQMGKGHFYPVSDARVMRNWDDRSKEIPFDAFRDFANRAAEGDGELTPEALGFLAQGFPHWVLTNCWVPTDEALVSQPLHELAANVNEMTRGVAPLSASEAAFAEGGKKAREMSAPLFTGFRVVMLLQAGIALWWAKGAFDIGGALFQLVVRKGGARVVAGKVKEAVEAPKLQLAGRSPGQVAFVREHYFQSSDLVHRYFNSIAPGVPMTVRLAVADALRAA